MRRGTDRAPYDRHHMELRRRMRESLVKVEGVDHASCASGTRLLGMCTILRRWRARLRQWQHSRHASVRTLRWWLARVVSPAAITAGCAKQRLARRQPTVTADCDL